MIAAGSYIRTLREERRLTQGDVIERAALRLGGHKIDTTTLWRIETGKKKTRSDILSAVVDAVEGNSDDVARLMGDSEATVADGEAAAFKWLSQSQIARIERIVEETPPDELAGVIDELRVEYRSDPALIIFIRGALATWRERGSRRQ